MAGKSWKHDVEIAAEDANMEMGPRVVALVEDNAVEAQNNTSADSEEVARGGHIGGADHALKETQLKQESLTAAYGSC